ncbi:unnamed protein product, partial [Pleuronectes platessa]
MEKKERAGTNIHIKTPHPAADRDGSHSEEAVFENYIADIEVDGKQRAAATSHPTASANVYFWAPLTDACALCGQSRIYCHAVAPAPSKLCEKVFSPLKTQCNGMRPVPRVHFHGADNTTDVWSSDKVGAARVTRSEYLYADVHVHGHSGFS